MSADLPGGADPGTVVPIQTPSGEASGEVILTLNAGDFVALQNDSPVPFTMVDSPNVGAQMDIVSIG